MNSQLGAFAFLTKRNQLVDCSATLLLSGIYASICMLAFMQVNSRVYSPFRATMAPFQ